MKLVLVRHGATEWSVNGRHTGTTDLPLLALGREQALAAKARVHDNIEPATMVRVYSSPMARARQTVDIVMGGTADPIIDERITEFDYGQYEGLTTPEIRERDQHWTVFDGCPGGESLEDVEARVDSFIASVRADTETSTSIVFSHGHLLRILGARAIGQPGAFAVHLGLDTASVSVVADLRDGPAITLWNDIRY